MLGCVSTLRISFLRTDIYAFQIAAEDPEVKATALLEAAIYSGYHEAFSKSKNVDALLYGYSTLVARK